MQDAETVLGVLRDRGRRGLPLNEIYRQLFNPQLYELAYGRIYANKGAMTPGADGETADGMSLGKIGRIIDAMRNERYRFSPVRRGTATIHTEEELFENKAPGPAVLVGQARRRSDPAPAGGVL